MGLLTSLFRLIGPTFPQGFCPSTYQELSDQIINGTQVTFLIDTGNFLYNYGSTTPAPENRIFPWLYTPNGRWYTFQFGIWTSPVDQAECVSDFCKLWTPPAGTLESALWSMDEGDGTDPSVPGNVTLVTGAMWKVNHSLDGRVPLGAGTIPNSGGAIVGAGQSSDSLGGTGEYAHQLTDAEGAVGQHTHPYGVNDPTSDDGFFSSLSSMLPTNGPYQAHFITGSGHGLSMAETLYNFQTLPSGNGAGVTATNHNNMQPYLGVYFITHTARRFYTLPA